MWNVPHYHLWSLKLVILGGVFTGLLKVTIPINFILQLSNKIIHFHAKGLSEFCLHFVTKKVQFVMILRKFILHLWFVEIVQSNKWFTWHQFPIQLLYSQNNFIKTQVNWNICVPSLRGFYTISVLFC